MTNNFYYIKSNPKKRLMDLNSQSDIIAVILGREERMKKKYYLNKL